MIKSLANMIKFKRRHKDKNIEEGIQGPSIEDFLKTFSILLTSNEKQI